MSKELINCEQQKKIYFLLLKAAKSKITIPYTRLYRGVFGDGTSFQVMNATLEAASKSLALPKDAIYSAFMAKKPNNCPGSGFYDIFRIHRAGEYRAIAGAKQASELSDSEEIRIAELERERVHEHAMKNYCALLPDS